MTQSIHEVVNRQTGETVFEGSYVEVIRWVFDNGLVVKVGKRRRLTDKLHIRLKPQTDST